MKYLVVFLIVVPVVAFSQSNLSKKGKAVTHEAHNHSSHDKSHKHKKGHEMKAGLKKITASEALVSVQGMVCAFCAQGIEKNFNKKDEVEKTVVNLDKMEVLIKFKKGKTLTESEIKKVVTGAGFKFKGIKNDK